LQAGRVVGLLEALQQLVLGVLRLADVQRGTDLAGDQLGHLRVDDRVDGDRAERQAQGHELLDDLAGRPARPPGDRHPGGRPGDRDLALALLGDGPLLLGPELVPGAGRPVVVEDHHAAALDLDADGALALLGAGVALGAALVAAGDLAGPGLALALLVPLVCCVGGGDGAGPAAGRRPTVGVHHVLDGDRAAAVHQVLRGVGQVLLGGLLRPGGVGPAQARRRRGLRVAGADAVRRPPPGPESRRDARRGAGRTGRAAALPRARRGAEVADALLAHARHPAG